MPRDKTGTRLKIMPAAKRIFLEKGYEKATMREIAAAAGITAAGLYRHFPDKEALFSALVEPVLEEMMQWYHEQKHQHYDYLEQGDLEAMWEQGADLTMMMELVYVHLDDFKLLLCCSEGTKYTGFLHEFIMLEQEETLAYMEAARQRGIPVQDIPSEELHLLLTAYCNALFEVVIHDFTREQALHYMKTLRKFFYPGWRAVLGL